MYDKNFPYREYALKPKYKQKAGLKNRQKRPMSQEHFKWAGYFVFLSFNY